MNTNEESTSIADLIPQWYEGGTCEQMLEEALAQIRLLEAPLCRSGAAIRTGAARRSSTGEPFRYWKSPEPDVTPDVVDGPDGFKFSCTNAEKVAVALNRMWALRSAIAPTRQVDKQVTLQASEYAQLVYDARRYEWLRDNMRRMPLGETGTRHFFDQPSTMSFQEAVDVAKSATTDEGANEPPHGR